ncbi:MAG: hypothetical protein V1882_09765 [Candidatus Omnitrophota bacterium]
MKRQRLFPSKFRSRNPNLAAILVVSCLLFPGVAFSDITSTNYQISGRFTSGNGNESSTSYQIEHSSVDTFSQVALSSTNYQLGSGAEAAATVNVSEIRSVSPGDHAKFYSDSTSDYTVTAFDPDNDSIQYRAKQDGTVKDGPQAGNDLSWALSDSDLGRKNIELAVVDPDGTIVKNQSAYIVRRPVK